MCLRITYWSIAVLRGKSGGGVLSSCRCCCTFTEVMSLQEWWKHLRRLQPQREEERTGLAVHSYSWKSLATLGSKKLSFGWRPVRRTSVVLSASNNMLRKSFSGCLSFFPLCFVSMALDCVSPLGCSALCNLCTVSLICVAHCIFEEKL